nr:hypothetical protein K10B2.3 - Caenorhabditis elegans [Caenorhabditis elegans]
MTPKQSSRFPFLLIAMQFIFFGTLFSGLLLVCAVTNDIEDASGETPGIVSQITEEQPHQRQKLYNWDYKDLGTIAFEDIPFPTLQPSQTIDQSENCPEGWIRYSDSCYWVETELLGFAKAERKCSEKQSTLFVANSIDEWEAIRGHSKDSFSSWIGLVRFSHYERSEQLPRWQTEGAVNPSKINWLIKPYSPLVNGWSQLANCAASYKSPASLETASYTYFYPCTYLFYSICERNSTIANSLH